VQPKRKSNAELLQESKAISAYLAKQQTELMDLYTKARAAKTKFYNEVDYYFTDEDRDSLIMLASAFSAMLRQTYRIFVIDQGFELASFWDSYIVFALFRQHVMFEETWKKIFKLDKALLKLIRKTSNPNFIEKIFTGDISLKWLTKELVRQMKRKRDDTGGGLS